MSMHQQKKYLFLAFIALFLFSLSSYAQLTQTIRGKVTDQLLQKPLAGATIIIGGSNLSATADADGSFRITGVPVGARQVIITHTGYNPVQMDNIIVNSGKETALDIAMEIDVDIQQAVEITAKSKKNRPLNEMSVVSARAFTVEETQRYAAAINDPLRMASSFAGVVSADDGNNEIVIRGNSPAGLLWRMEGVDIPNPNHFSSAGSSGGGVSILSAQLLANSDFVTGAFAAEYGNALSGVFDLRLRKGNSDKREYTAQVGLLGLNLAAEGPLARSYKGSYLVNYRYSTLQALSKIGLEIAGGITNFQDLSFNIYLPAGKAGEFTLFGFGGLSDQDMESEKDPLKWESEGDRYGGVFKANTGATGITHGIALGLRTHLKSSVALSYAQNEYNELYDEGNGSLLNTYRNQYRTKKWILSSVVNHQVNAKNSIRGGVTANIIGYDFYQKSRETPEDPVLERINQSDNTETLQAFAQWQYKPMNRLSVQAGAHYLRLLLNNSHSLEPRASVKYELDRKNALAFGYGLHSQVQSLGVYFAKAVNTGGATFQPNKDLSFTRAHHYVLSYSHAFRPDLRFKAEAYYQSLFDVPVSIYDSLSFSTLNIRGDYTTEALTNKGKGRNYGIDLSLEKYLRNNIYFMVNTSLYQSKYTASDGIERDTRFNGNYVSNFTGGKDIVLKDGKRTIGAHIKIIYAGGFRNTPIDIERSIEKGYTIWKEKEAFTLQNPNYFRTDLRIAMKWNRKRLTSTLSLDIQNLSNRLNLYNQYFDAFKGQVVNNYQTGIIPVLNYKVDF
ncbi:MAG: TonB-dependent receptor [Chitinophagaceae bacterium]|nr:TonB-dependent receptor [Chitinophagaceae bacterium]